MSTKTNFNNQLPILEVKNLQTAFEIDGELHNAVDDVSFSVKPKQIVGVVGESGCGKSVMSLSVMKLLPKGIGQIRAGEVIFDGRNIEKLSDKEMNKFRGRCFYDIPRTYDIIKSSLYNWLSTSGNSFQSHGNY